MPLFAGILSDQQCVQSLSKNEHCLLLWLQRPIKCPNMVSSSLPLCTMVQGDLFYLQTNGKQNPSSRTAENSTKSIDCKSLLFHSFVSKITEPCIKIVNPCKSAIVEINTLLATLVVYYFQLLHWFPWINLYFLFIIAVCQEGYEYNEMNDMCKPCMRGWYKSSIVNANCTMCPMEMSTTSTERSCVPFWMW